MRKPGILAAALLAALALALTVPVASPGAGVGQSDHANQAVVAGLKAVTKPKLSSRELAGQRIITGFRGSSPPGDLKRAIKRGQIAGVVLFPDNADTASSARALTRKLQSIDQPRGLRKPLLVMTDQEGGLVKRIAGPPNASAEQMGARGNGYTKRQGNKTGKLLRTSGINIDLAPVLDVGRRGSAIASEHRTFGSSARRVTQRTSAFTSGLRRHDIVPTAKHFPGLGAVKVNTDQAAQTIGLSRSKLRRIDEKPYQRFSHSGRGMVMLSLAKYRAFDDNLAALSHRIATTELRDRIGFRGVSISDSLAATAARAVGGTNKVARKAAGAGTDLLLYQDLSEARQAGRTLARLLRKGQLGKSRFKDSANRVLALRDSLGR